MTAPPRVTGRRVDECFKSDGAKARDRFRSAAAWLLAGWLANWLIGSARNGRTDDFFEEK
jgi:hypothetical protein